MRNQGAFKLVNRWDLIAWVCAFALIVSSGILGFVVLSGYQQNGPTLGVWAAICRGLGIVADIAPSEEPKPPLRTPTSVAWTATTLDQIAFGDASHGQFIAINCVACHGERGISASSLVPTLAGMDAAVIFKQLVDYRSGKRLWGVMSAIAQALSADDFADVATYFAVQPDGLVPLSGGRVPASGRSLREADPARRLVFAGDPQRAIPPCAACHGPGGFKTGVPALESQQGAYIERQLASFAQGIRQNDIYSQMRAIAKELTPAEMRALASYYANNSTQ
jgi:cytochrome c553